MQGNGDHAGAVATQGRRPRGGPVARQFAVTFDYRCPFARNGHDVGDRRTASRSRLGRHVPAVLARPGPRRRGRAPGLGTRPGRVGHRRERACCWGIAVRDEFPDKFLDWHLAAFTARHDHGAKIAKDEVLAEIATSVGLDPAAVARRGRVGAAVEDARAEPHRRGEATTRSSASRRSSSATRPCSCA